MTTLDVGENPVNGGHRRRTRDWTQPPSCLLGGGPERQPVKCPCTLSADGPSSPSHSIRSLDGTVKLAAMSDKVGPLC